MERIKSVQLQSQSLVQGIEDNLAGAQAERDELRGKVASLQHVQENLNRNINGMGQLIHKEVI